MTVGDYIDSVRRLTGDTVQTYRVGDPEIVRYLMWGYAELARVRPAVRYGDDGRLAESVAEPFVGAPPDRSVATPDRIDRFSEAICYSAAARCLDREVSDTKDPVKAAEFRNRAALLMGQ